MKPSNIRSSILACWNVEGGHHTVFNIMGKPGGGKSSVARAIFKELMAAKGIPQANYVEINPSLMESTDFLGVPDITGECTRWCPPSELYRLRDGQGPCCLLIEEMADAAMDVQNPLCRLILDRYAGQLKLTNELYIIATSNRTQDKSGANRLSTKLANRMRYLAYEESLEDWLEWARKEGINPLVRAFLRFRPALFSPDFNTSEVANATPRSWVDVARIPIDVLPKNDFRELVAGSVGDGPAMEYCGFLDVYRDLPDMSNVFKEPEKAEVPTNESVQFAVLTKLASMVKKPQAAAFCTYVSRFPVEFQTFVFRELSISEHPVTRTPAFIKLATQLQQYLV